MVGGWMGGWWVDGLVVGEFERVSENANFGLGQFEIVGVIPRISRRTARAVVVVRQSVSIFYFLFLLNHLVPRLLNLGRIPG